MTAKKYFITSSYITFATICMRFAIKVTGVQTPNCITLYIIWFFFLRFNVQEQQVFWNATPPTIRKQRLTRYTVPLDQQGEFESERLWQHVSAAILRDDMNAATEEKTILEEAQRGTHIMIQFVGLFCGFLSNRITFGLPKPFSPLLMVDKNFIKNLHFFSIDGSYLQSLLCLPTDGIFLKNLHCFPIDGRCLQTLRCLLMDVVVLRSKHFYVDGSIHYL